MSWKTSIIREAKYSARRIHNNRKVRYSLMQKQMWKQFAKADVDNDGYSIIEVLQFKLEKMKSMTIPEANLRREEPTDETILSKERNEIEKTLALGYRILDSVYDTGSSGFLEKNSDVWVSAFYTNDDGKKIRVVHKKVSDFQVAESLDDIIDEKELAQKYGPSVTVSVELEWKKPEFKEEMQEIIRRETAKQKADVEEYMAEIGHGIQNWWN